MEAKGKDKNHSSTHKEEIIFIRLRAVSIFHPFNSPSKEREEGEMASAFVSFRRFLFFLFCLSGRRFFSIRVLSESPEHDFLSDFPETSGSKTVDRLRCRLLERQLWILGFIQMKLPLADFFSSLS